jgi:hypothetical protein
MLTGQPLIFEFTISAMLESGTPDMLIFKLPPLTRSSLLELDIAIRLPSGVYSSLLIVLVTRLSENLRTTGV